MAKKSLNSVVSASCENCRLMNYSGNDKTEIPECSIPSVITDHFISLDVLIAIRKIPEPIRSFCKHYGPIESMQGRIVYR